MRTLFLSILFSCVALLAQGQLRQQLELTIGGTMSWSNTTYEDILTPDAGFYHQVSGSYGIGWLGHLDEKNSLRITLRVAHVNSGFKIDWFDVNYEEYIGISNSSTFGFAPLQFNLNLVRKLRQLGTKWALSGHIGMAYSYSNASLLSQSSGVELRSRSDRQVLRTFWYQLYPTTDRDHNMLFNLGGEITFTNTFNQALVLRLDAQFGLFTAVRQVAEYSLQNHEAGTIQYGRAARLIRGSNIALELSYRFPFMERHYQRRLKRRKKKAG